MATQTDVYSAQHGNVFGHAPADDTGAMLGLLTAQIQAQIAEVEQRHADALAALQSKLERMSGTADRARPQMPAELAGAFERIEAGMADLVGRIAEAAPERRRNAEAFVFAPSKAESSHFVFNPPKRVPVAPVSLNGIDGASEPWDRDSAEALANLYESGEAVLGKHLPEAALFAPAQWRAQQADQAGTFETIPSPVQAPPPAPLASIVAAGLGDDREWLDKRLTTIAEQVSKSIVDARPDAALKTLMSRVDQLETRFTSAIEGIASKSDVAAMRQDSLQEIEAQIKQLAGHVDSTHRQLTRLDAIEQHLSDLTAFAHASMEADEAASADGAAAADHAHDFAQLADLAVERALARAPAVTGAAVEPAETQARVDAVHALLQEFAAERRRGDQYTTGMLETVQEALIRLIDRVDAIDAGAARPVEAPPQVAAEPATTAVKMAAVPPAPATPAAEAADHEHDTIAEAEVKAKMRRRARAVETPPEPDAEMAAEAIEADAPAQPEISIKDLRLNARSARVGVPLATQNANVSEPAPEQPAAKPARTARAAPATAASGNAGKRGLAVAAMALSLVGIGFLAQHLLSGGDAPVLEAAPLSAAPTKTPAELGKPVAQPASAGQAAPATRPPGMMTPPGRLEAAPQSNGVTILNRPAGAATEQVPGPRSDATGQPNALKGPATVPETVSDDLSMIDVDDTNSVVAPVSAPDLPRIVPQGRTLASVQPIQGLAISNTSTTVTPQQINEFTGMQRQYSQAAASERVGLNARPAGDFSQRFGTIAAPAPAAAAPQPNAAASIVTGSNPAPRAPQPGTEPSLSDEVPPPADMPPALVGPLSLRMAAAKGEPSAAFEVATRFAEGRGIKQDFKQALVWYQRAANKGLAIAQYRLGTLYERGIGTVVDAARARMWYKRAADQGNVKAMHNMAVLSAGNSQSAPDYTTAAKWFKDAADRGLADSQFNLGVLFENGLGVNKDPRTAYLWFSLAARGGDAEAGRRRDLLLATLDADTLKSANDQVQNWRAKAVDNKVNDPRVAGDQWRRQQAQMEEPVAAPAIPQPLAAAPAPANQAPAPRVIKVPH